MLKYNNLKEDVQKELLVAAHRGSASGMIPGNTLGAYDAALFGGADIIELDVMPSRDGELFVFHPRSEYAHLNHQGSIPEMLAEDVRKLRYVNQDRQPTEFGVCTLDEAFKHLKGRCYINVDSFWRHMEGAAELIRRNHIEDQVIIKTYVGDDTFRGVEKYAPDLPYMVMMREVDVDTEKLMQMNLNYIGSEILFSTEDAPIAQPSYLERMHEMGLYVWCNATVPTLTANLNAGHNDNVSVRGNPELGWGWLADRGYDMMQTDWAACAVRYLQESGKKRR